MTDPLYHPLNTLKPVGPDPDAGIWIADGPSVPFYGINFPTRMTVVRVNGKLWVHSPIAIDEGLLDQLADLGPIGWLIAPNPIHYVSVHLWHKRFPQAQVLAAPGVKERAAKYGVPFPKHDVLTDEAPGGPEGYAADIRQRLVRGHRFLHEVVFYHMPSNTLILTDLIENFEAHKVGRMKAFLMRIAGILDPDGKAPADMRGSFKSKKQAREVMREVISWQPEQVILSHGRWYQRNGTAELKRAFRWLRV
ncbi:DUF4336 domain-containing protein [Celeribacter neptunius]|uniref:DUF4336 domain-containing protein n=1 Tax=Celeribacter neptunius TaxID=588602 RepID=UPI000B7E070F|nr:DUF4336 domain-containing protein [Celeribacter neptunius]